MHDSSGKPLDSNHLMSQLWFVPKSASAFSLSHISFTKIRQVKEKNSFRTGPTGNGR